MYEVAQIPGIGWVVVDISNGRKIVSDHKWLSAAERACDVLNAEVTLKVKSNQTVKMVIGKRTNVKVSYWHLSRIIEWERRINGMDYHFAAWCQQAPEGTIRPVSHTFIYPKFGEGRMIMA